MKKIILLVAGIIGIVVLVAAILLYINRGKITNFAADRTLNYVEMQVMQHVADPHRADSVRTDFAKLHERLRAGRFSARSTTWPANDDQARLRYDAAGRVKCT